jgi:hypothetical protein
MILNVECEIELDGYLDTKSANILRRIDSAVRFHSPRSKPHL